MPIHTECCICHGVLVRTPSHIKRNRQQYCSVACRSIGHHREAEARFLTLRHICEHGSLCTSCCWLWQGAIGSTGYGHFYLGNRCLGAHRYAYELASGPLPKGRFVCHSCDTRACVNPQHVWLGTAADNTHDAQSKDRLATGERHGSRTHPERLERGDRHYARRRPHLLARGANHGTRTQAERLQRGEQRDNATLTEESVRAIRHAAVQGESQPSLAQRCGVSQARIWAVIHRKAWKHVPDIRCR